MYFLKILLPALYADKKKNLVCSVHCCFAVRPTGECAFCVWNRERGDWKNQWAGKRGVQTSCLTSNQQPYEELVGLESEGNSGMHSPSSNILKVCERLVGCGSFKCIWTSSSHNAADHDSPHLSRMIALQQNPPKKYSDNTAIVIRLYDSFIYWLCRKCLLRLPFPSKSLGNSH